jgi:Flp pilus assembly protein CpaB
MTYSMRNIALAVAAAVAAAVVVLLYTTSYKAQVTREQQQVKVLVARVEIPAGTPAAKAAGSMEVREVLQTDKTPGAVSDADAIGSTKVATQTIYAGQQVVGAAFQPALTQNPQLQLTKTERGIRVMVNTASGVLGVIRPGDRVDVFGSFTKVKVEGKSGDYAITRRLLEDVRVLEAPVVDAKTDKKTSDGDKKQPVMLAVSQRDATKLAFMAGADDEAKVWLVARPPVGQGEEQPVTMETLSSMLLSGLTPAEVRAKFPQLIAAPSRATKATPATAGNGG